MAQPLRASRFLKAKGQKISALKSQHKGVAIASFQRHDHRRGRLGHIPSHLIYDTAPYWSMTAMPHSSATR
jgi:hypothetical protein